MTFTGGILLQPTDRVVLASINDITNAVTSGDLQIQRYTGTGSALDQSIYAHVDHSNTDAVVFESAIGYSSTNTLIWHPPRQQRLRGRTLHRQNHLGMMPRAVQVDFSTATPGEIAALQLLRQLVGQDEFRRYLKYGFVMVRGISGLRYQIRRGQHTIDVWNERGRVDRICVYLQGQFPPTDDTITRMLMAERDELELWKRGNSRAGRAVSLEDLARLYVREVEAA